jgi:hypothetical protein
VANRILAQQRLVAPDIPAPVADKFAGVLFGLHKENAAGRDIEQAGDFPLRGSDR